jgi:hypothetical protein
MPTTLTSLNLKHRSPSQQNQNPPINHVARNQSKHHSSTSVQPMVFRIQMRTLFLAHAAILCRLLWTQGLRYLPLLILFSWPSDGPPIHLLAQWSQPVNSLQHPTLIPNIAAPIMAKFPFAETSEAELAWAFGVCHAWAALWLLYRRITTGIWTYLAWFFDSSWR